MSTIRSLCILFLALVSSVPTIAEDNDPTWDEKLKCTQFSGYSKKWLYRRADLRHPEVIWLSRDGEGKFLAHAQVGAVTNPGAAAELALYLDRLEIPRTLRAGIMIYDASEPYVAGSGKPVLSHSGFLVTGSDGSGWFQKSDDKEVVFFSVYLIAADDCVVGSIKVGNISTGEGYDTRAAKRRPHPQNVDVFNFTQNVSTRNCGPEYFDVETEGETLWGLDPTEEVWAVQEDKSVSSYGGGHSRSFVLAGKEVTGFLVSHFPGRVVPRISVKGGAMILELPKYISRGVIPRHVTIECISSQAVRFRLMAGSEVKVFEQIPVIIRDVE